MTFALSGSNITQTGTDANLSGLSAVAGVTTKVLGSGNFIKTYYYLPNNTNLVYNDLSINPRSECLVFGTGAVTLSNGSSTAVLNIGALITQNGGTYGSSAEAIIFQDNSGLAYTVTSGLKITQGTLNWYSGRIRCQTCIGIGSPNYNNNGNASAALLGRIEKYAVLEVMASPSGQAGESCQMEFAAAPSFVLNGLTVIGYGSSPQSVLWGMCTPTQYSNPPVLNLQGAAGLTYQAGSFGTAPVTASQAPQSRQSNFLTLYGLTSSASNKAANIWLGSLLRVVNASVGSALPVVEHNGDSQHSQGYVEIRNEAKLSFQTQAGAAIANAVCYLRDSNNGKRKLYNLCQQNINNTTDKVYIQSTDATGLASFTGTTNSILLCAVAHLNAVYSGLNNSGENAKDFRSMSGVEGADDFRFHTWAYGYSYLQTNVALRSDGVAYAQSMTLLTDVNVTLSETAAVAKLASSFIVSTTGGGTLTITANSTLDDVYDAMKAFKTRPVQAQLEFPNIATAPVVASGTTLSTAMNVVVNTGVTLSVGTKFKFLQTTATLTLNGTGAVSTSYQDSAGLRATISGLDPEGLGTTWYLGWMKDTDYQARDTTKAPALWAGWNQKSGTGNSTQIALQPNTGYQLFHLCQGYETNGGPLDSLNTATQTEIALKPIADRDLMGGLLWPQTAAHSTQAALFTYNSTAKLVEFANTTGTGVSVPFLAAYRAFERVAKNELPYMFVAPVRVNGTKNGFVVPDGNPIKVQMTAASNAGATLLADVSYTNQAPAFDRFLANSANAGGFLIVPRVSAGAVSAADISNIKAKLEEPGGLLHKAAKNAQSAALQTI